MFERLQQVFRQLTRAHIAIRRAQQQRSLAARMIFEVQTQLKFMLIYFNQNKSTHTSGPAVTSIPRIDSK